MGGTNGEVLGDDEKFGDSLGLVLLCDACGRDEGLQEGIAECVDSKFK
jgi:hypothetical protein